jgi:hypothetical protein
MTIAIGQLFFFASASAAAIAFFAASRPIGGPYLRGDVGKRARRADSGQQPGGNYIAALGLRRPAEDSF